MKSHFTPHFVKFRHSYEFTSYFCTFTRMVQSAHMAVLMLSALAVAFVETCIGALRVLCGANASAKGVERRYISHSGLTPEGGRQNNCSKHVYVQCACWLCLCGDGVRHVRCAWVKCVRRRAKYLFEGAQPYADGVVLVHAAKNVSCAVLMQCHVHLRRKHEKKDDVREFRVGHRRPAVGGHAGARGTAIHPA